MKYKNEHITYVYLLKSPTGTIFCTTSENRPGDYSDKPEAGLDNFPCELLGTKVIHWGDGDE
jgi:hypothetical protein